MENRKEVIGITSFRAEDRNLNPSNTCDYHVPVQMIAWIIFKLRYALMLLNKKCLISMFHCAFFNSIIDKYQHMHFFTFITVLV